MAEDIEIKPSVEGIPDEYLHAVNTTAVHIFTSKNEEDLASAETLKNTLLRHGYSIDSNHHHCLDTENIYETLETVCTAEQDPGGLILFFSGRSRSDGTILAFDGKEKISLNVQAIVTKFTAYTHLHLKNKPKICIFHVKSPPVQIQTDSIGRFGHRYHLTYDSPAEADLLLIYKKTENGIPSDFTEQLCKKINEHGKAEDILTLTALMEFSKDESRPLAVSTLTRKFYFVPNDHRGHHTSINDMQEEVMAALDYIHNKISKEKAKNSKSSGRATQNGERRRLGSNRSIGSVSTDSAPKPRWRF